MKHKALLLLRKISKGRVASYKELGKTCNTSPRVIGRVMAANKRPDKYPCYKVVHADGRVGNYSGGGGSATKIKLLRKDGIMIKNGRVDRKYFWKSGSF